MAENNTQTSSDPNPPVNGGKKAEEFDIPKFVTANYPDLITLILETKSMDDKERQYWFHILPIMSEKQVTKLRTILTNEKQKLAEIDDKYNKKMAEIQGGKPVEEWEDGKLKEKFEEIETRESVAEKKEAAAEAALLDQLEDI